MEPKDVLLEAEEERACRAAFACAALQGLLHPRYGFTHQIPKLAWDYADAMIAERKRRDREQIEEARRHDDALRKSPA